jgi:hypothetical protein
MLIEFEEETSLKDVLLRIMFRQEYEEKKDSEENKNEKKQFIKLIVV